MKIEDVPMGSIFTGEGSKCGTMYIRIQDTDNLQAVILNGQYKGWLTSFSDTEELRIVLL